MTKKLIIVFAVLAVSLASAKTYNLTLFQTAQVAGQELKAGEYRLELQDSKVIIKSGKQSIEAQVKVENNGEKYRSTTVRYVGEASSTRVQEIRLGGTNTKVVFNP